MMKKNLLGLLCLLTGIATHAQTPFGCTNTMYSSMVNSSTSTTVLRSISTTSNPFTFNDVGSASSFTYNALGYNTVDNYMYAIRTSNYHLYRIDANGTYTDLGLVSGLPASGFYNSGDFDSAGNFYVKTGLSSIMYKINITTLTATSISLTKTINTADFAYNPVNGLLYAADYGNSNRLISIDPATGIVTTIGTATTSGLSFGAMYIDVNGNVYGIQNNDGGSNPGGFYKFDIITGERTLISSVPVSNANDGANCPNAVLTFGSDLYVTKTDNVATYIPGSTVTYTIIVGNTGPFGAQNAPVNDAVPAGIPAANVTYTAIASAGSATNVVGTQTGAINDLVNLPVGGTVTYTVTVAIPLNFTGNLTNTAAIDVPSGTADNTMANNSATDIDSGIVCYKPAATSGISLPTNYGITSLGRAGTTNGNWPMVRNGAWTVLEAKTKGFVINRLTTLQKNALSPVDGMMVYDTNLDCLSIYDGTGWKCFNTQTCP